MRRVLVADDNRDAADSMAVLLEWLGYDVRVAYDGASAIRLADEFEPQLAILDINMPQIDGYEVARTLRQSHGDKVMLVALTGVPSWETNVKAFESGFDRHFAKPMDGREIEDVLQRLS